VVCTKSPAVHKDSHWRDLQTTEGADLTGFGNAGGNIASQEGSLLRVKDLPHNVRESRVISVVNDGEFLIRIRLSACGGGVTEQEADGYDQITTLFDEGIDVLLVVGLLLRLEELTLNPEFACIFDTLPSCLSSIPPVSVTWQTLIEGAAGSSATGSSGAGVASGAHATSTNAAMIRSDITANNFFCMLHSSIRMLRRE
jgi:hypothetical protein